MSFIQHNKGRRRRASAAATVPAAWALAETMAALFVVFRIVDMNN
jgi:hypothetical protein